MNNLRACRKRAGLTQRQLANTLGVSISTIREYEQFRKPLDGSRAFTVEDLARILDCTVEDLTTDRPARQQEVTCATTVEGMARILRCPVDDLIDLEYGDHDDDEEEFLV